MGDEVFWCEVGLGRDAEMLMFKHRIISKSRLEQEKILH
jgi:hypothetical protein